MKPLLELATENDLLIVLKIRAGHFMLHDTSHFEVHSNEPVSDDILTAIAKSFLVGSGRTPTQDLEFSVRQLVEIALRGLSPSLNDPFTAIISLARRLSDLLQVARSDEKRQAVTKHLQMFERAAQAIPEPLDRQDLLSVIADAKGREGTWSGT